MAFEDAVEEEDNNERERRNEEEEEEEEGMKKKTTSNSAQINTTTAEKTAAQTEDDDEEEESDSDSEESSSEEDEEELAKWRNTTYEVGDRVSAFASWFQTKDKYLPARVIHETTKKETRGVFGKGGDAAKKSGSGDGASATVVQMIKRYYWLRRVLETDGRVVGRE